MHTKIFFFVIELEGEKKKHNQNMISLYTSTTEMYFYCVFFIPQLHTKKRQFCYSNFQGDNFGICIKCIHLDSVTSKSDSANNITFFSLIWLKSFSKMWPKRHINPQIFANIWWVLYAKSNLKRCFSGITNTSGGNGFWVVKVYF